jgi:hypothetical protein
LLQDSTRIDNEIDDVVLTFSQRQQEIANHSPTLTTCHPKR